MSFPSSLIDFFVLDVGFVQYLTTIFLHLNTVEVFHLESTAKQVAPYLSVHACTIILKDNKW